MDSKNKPSSKGTPSKSSSNHSKHHHKKRSNSKEDSDSSEERLPPRKHQRDDDRPSKAKRRRARKHRSRSRSSSSSSSGSDTSRETPQSKSKGGLPRHGAEKVASSRMDSRGLSKGTILSNPHAFNNAIAINNAAKSDSNVVEVALIDIIGTQEVM